MFILNVKTLSGACQREIATPTKFEREKTYRAQQYKSACVSALTVSLPREIAEGQQRVSEVQHPARIEPMSPDALQLASTTNPSVRADLPKKKVDDMTLIYQNALFLYINLGIWV